MRNEEVSYGSGDSECATLPRDNRPNDDPSTTVATISPRDVSLASAIMESTPLSMALRTECDSANTSLHSNLHVSNLPTHVDENNLRQLFAPFGEIESCVVMRDIFTGVSRGIGFVKFALVPSATDAIAALDGTVLPTASSAEARIRVQLGNEFHKGSPTARIFARNIPSTLPDADVHKYFSQFGTIKWISIQADTAAAGPELINANKIAFVTYSSRASAAEAVLASHNTQPFPHSNGVPLLTKVILESKSRRAAKKIKRSDTAAIGLPAQLPLEERPPGSNSVSSVTTPNVNVTISAIPPAQFQIACSNNNSNVLFSHLYSNAGAPQYFPPPPPSFYAPSPVFSGEQFVLGHCVASRSIPQQLPVLPQRPEGPAIPAHQYLQSTGGRQFAAPAPQALSLAPSPLQFTQFQPQQTPLQSSFAAFAGSTNISSNAFHNMPVVANGAQFQLVIAQNQPQHYFFPHR